MAGLLYGGLEALEGFGLLLRRRWAEYLVLVAMMVFIPVEVQELAVRPSVAIADAIGSRGSCRVTSSEARWHEWAIYPRVLLSCQAWPISNSRGPVT